MKKFKKVLALALALALALSLSMPVFAAEDYSDGYTTLPGKPGGSTSSDVDPGMSVSPADAEMVAHKFTAFQIFSGTQAEAGGSLGDIVWGTGIVGDDKDNPNTNNADAFLAALKADPVIGTDLKDAKTALDVAAVISGWVENDPAETDNEKVLKFAEIADKFVIGNGISADKDGNVSMLDPGYYLVRDAGYIDGGTDENPVVYNLATLTMNTAAPFRPTTKTDIPQVDKQVLEVNDSEGTSAWAPNADHDIGDVIPFVLTGTLPSNYGDYEKYTYVFHDTMSAGLTYTEGSVKVYLGGTTTEIPAEQYEVSAGKTEDGKTELTVSFENLKNYKDEDGNEIINAGSYIQVVYTAELNKDAVIGGDGNSNEVYLEFSNNPNNGGEGDKGTTPPKTSIVFTFELTVNKTDKDGNPLKGAGFTLFKIDKDGNEVAVGDEVKAEDLTTFEFKGLDAGDYRLKETTTPAGYNTIDPIDFKIVAAETVDQDTGEGEVTKLEVWQNDENGESVISQDFKVELPADGQIATDIVNQRGLLLPSTGGIGTTIFYTVGGLLVVAAVVLLITKKRMGKAE